jgi:ribosomal protein S18 acetylase RimI-like enzyme
VRNRDSLPADRRNCFRGFGFKRLPATKATSKSGTSRLLRRYRSFWFPMSPCPGVIQVGYGCHAALRRAALLTPQCVNSVRLGLKDSGLDSTALGDVVPREGTIIRDGGSIDTVRIGTILHQCLTASPDVYPVALANCYSDYLSSELIRSFLSRGGHLIMAEERNQTVGFACGVPDSSSAGFGTYYGAWVAVADASRRQGLGMQLLKALELRAFGSGCHKCYVLVLSTNQPGIELFFRAGYVVEGVLRRHWKEQDYLLMSYFRPDTQNQDGS